MLEHWIVELQAERYVKRHSATQKSALLKQNVVSSNDVTSNQIGSAAQTSRIRLVASYVVTAAPTMHLPGSQSASRLF